MTISDILSRVLEITTSFNFGIAAMLFVLCAIGETVFTLPYILETIWLLAGSQLANGTLPPIDLLLIWLVAQAGRQVGSLGLYYSGVLGGVPLVKFYKKYIEPKLPKRKYIPTGLTKFLASPSVFSVALGRLTGLRIPMAFAMGAKQRWSSLALGVLLSSIVWDGTYLAVGSIVGAVLAPKPVYMLLYSLAALTALYLITIAVQFLLQFIRHKKRITQ